MKHDERGEAERREPAACEWAGTAAAFLMGSIDGSALRSFLQHVDSGCAECGAEIAGDRETLAYMDATELWNDPTLDAPPAGLYETIRARLDEQKAPAGDSIQKWKSWSSSARPSGVPALQTLRASESDWQSIDVEGIRVRQLAVDPERRLVTMLIRMDAKSCYPPHRHAAAEECYVIEGELHVEDGLRGKETLLHAGDFQRAEAGSIHGRQWTDRGCTLLIVSSQDDELVA
jgi:quercetin dioxygenase-like cupin family protein